MSKIYTCEYCKGEFQNPGDWDEQEKLSEMEMTFGEVPEDQRESVCDYCYRVILAWLAEKRRADPTFHCKP